MGTVLLPLGLLFAFALGLGRLCARIHVPKVTGYLVAGLLAGPSMAHILGIAPIITHGQLEALSPIHDLALALIVLTIGAQFQFQGIRKFGSRLLKVSFVEMGLTGTLVFAATWAAGASIAVAGFLALMAITTAPAATQMVVREYESEGPVTDLALTLIGLNNIAAIVLFIIIGHFVVTPGEPLVHVLYQIGVPIGLGTVGGALLALFDQRLASRIERQILCIAAAGLLIGVSSMLEVSSLLTSLLAGAVLVNASPHGRRLIDDLAGIDIPLYILFFIFAGAELHLASLPLMGAVGVAYIVARIVGKFFGCRTGARLAGMPGATRTWLGPSMLAQAGLAIGLASALAEDWGENGKMVQTAVLASVVIFEGLGPLVTRIALVRAGEVSILSFLSQRRTVGYAEGLHEVIDHFREAIGLPHFHKLESPSDIMVEHVMRKNVEVVHTDTQFDTVLKTFGHSRYDRLPVVDDEERLTGVIQYSDVSEVLFEPGLRHLIVAGDIASQEHLLLKPDDTLETAMKALRDHPDHTYLLVVDSRDQQRLVGVLRHNDVLSTQQGISAAN